MKKIITSQEAASKIESGMTVMVGGFLGCGTAQSILQCLSESDVRDLTIISNDASIPTGPDGSLYYGLASLIHKRQVKELITSHVGLNAEVSEQVSEGELLLVLVPQGSLVEMIRSGGIGMGGIITPTGVGTMVEDYEYVIDKITIDGRQYLIQKALHADVALINGTRIDTMGNVWYKGTTRNFNQVMAMAADTVIAEADQIVDLGELEPENIMTPGILVDYVVEKGGK